MATKRKSTETVHTEEKAESTLKPGQVVLGIKTSKVTKEQKIEAVKALVANGNHKLLPRVALLNVIEWAVEDLM